MEPLTYGGSGKRIDLPRLKQYQHIVLVGVNNRFHIPAAAKDSYIEMRGSYNVLTGEVTEGCVIKVYGAYNRDATYVTNHKEVFNVPEKRVEEPLTPPTPKRTILGKTEEPVGPQMTDEERRALAIERINRVFQEYGDYRCDVSTYIAHQALENQFIKETGVFTAAILEAQWLNLETSSTGQLCEVADKLAVSWHKAWQKAEDLGYEAMGDHAEDAKRAAKFAARAADPKSSITEVEVALKKLKPLLDICGITLRNNRKEITPFMG